MFAAVLATLALASLSAATPIELVVPLSGSNEVPSVATAASGTATLSLDPDVLADGIDFVIQLQTITAPLLEAHIHGAPPGQNGAILVTLFSFCDLAPNGCDGDPGEVEITGANLQIAGNVALSVATLNAILAGEAYVNVHTEAFVSGELRGNIIPEPGTAGLLGLGLAGLAGRRRFSAR